MIFICSNMYGIVSCLGQGKQGIKMSQFCEMKFYRPSHRVIGFMAANVHLRIGVYLQMLIFNLF